MGATAGSSSRDASPRKPRKGHVGTGHLELCADLQLVWGLPSLELIGHLGGVWSAMKAHAGDLHLAASQRKKMKVFGGGGTTLQKASPKRRPSDLYTACCGAVYAWAVLTLSKVTSSALPPCMTSAGAKIRQNSSRQLQMNGMLLLGTTRIMSGAS